MIEHVTNDGMLRVRARSSTVTRVETNSELRMDQTRAGHADPPRPGDDVLDDDRRPPRNTREAAALAEQMPATGVGARPHLWVGRRARGIHPRPWRTSDDLHPRADGHMPVAVAGDPTRRADLIAPDTFPAGGRQVDGRRPAAHRFGLVVKAAAPRDRRTDLGGEPTEDAVGGLAAATSDHDETRRCHRINER